MPSPTFHRPTTAPHLPGAWPTPSRDYDDPQDADVSSVSSHGSFSASLRAHRDSNRRTRRRWTYAGPPHDRLTRFASPNCPISGPLRASASQQAKMSPLTDNTVSTPQSSPLNTPDLADWPTRLGGSQALLSDNIVSSSSAASPSLVARYRKLSPVRRTLDSFPRPPRLSSRTSRHQCLPSPHLDPPLSNLVPGLAPLNLPFPDLSTVFPLQDLPSAPPSPHSAFSTHSATQSHLHLDPFTADTDCSPLGDVVPLSPQLSESYVSSASQDSPILPAAMVAPTPCEDPASMQLPPPAHEMDAFALATAVATSNSRSSFSIPPSVQSATVALPVLELPVLDSTIASSDVPRPHAYRGTSAITSASTGHPYAEASCYWGDFAANSDTAGLVVPPAENNVRARRLSAPPNTTWHSPRIQPARTISSRVDVGEGNVTRRKSRQVRPVLVKVRKFGERIRGLFKGRGEYVPKIQAGNHGGSLEYGLMTTTTSITNVEYESEHPIPMPSPRARMMRNYRRSLPLPLFLPAVADRIQPAIPGRPTQDHNDGSRHASTFPRREGAAFKEHTTIPEYQPTSHDLDDHRRSPRTPKPRRERTQVPSQPNENEPHAPGERKAKSLRRFSLSSALAKSKIDTLRSTVVPRPPLPTVSSRIKDNVNVSTSAPSFTSHLEAPVSISIDDGSLVVPSTTHSQEQFWGGELPTTQPVYEIRSARSSSDDSPTRTRTRTAPSQPETSTPKDKRSRRFSLSSLMAKRSLRPLASAPGHGHQHPSPVSPMKTRRFSRRRPRGDTVPTITRETMQPDTVAMEPGLDIAPVLPSSEIPPFNRLSVVSSIPSSGAESMYFDAQEQVSDDDYRPDPDRPRSPRSESDLDSMSFARTPDYSSGTFSFGSSTEREYCLEASDPSYLYRHNTPGRFASTGTMAHLVADSSTTPITKTLRFSPSLNLSFEMSSSDLGDDDEIGRMEREEELSFMRALGFEFDEIARRVREETL